MVVVHLSPGSGPQGRPSIRRTSRADAAVSSLDSRPEPPMGSLPGGLLPGSPGAGSGTLPPLVPMDARDGAGAALRGSGPHAIPVGQSGAGLTDRLA
jgi:hypothetical protein